MTELEQYINKLKTLSPKYQWPIERYESRQNKREELQKEFPYIVTFEGAYGEGQILDTMEDWCLEQFGLQHGECTYDHPSPTRGPCKYADIDEEEFAELCKEFPNEFIPDYERSTYEHSHKGRWTCHFVLKTGYDYGFQNFCFQNIEDAMAFKIYWTTQ